MDGSKMTGRYKKMKKGKSWVIILVAVICIGLLGWYSTAVITDTKQKQEATANGESTKDKDYQNIKLGLDLSGGVSITYHIKDKNPSDKDVNDTIAKLSLIHILKVILIGKTLRNDKAAYASFMEYCKTSKKFPRNTYVCIADDINDIFDNMGDYYEQKMNKENHEDGEPIITLGTLSVSYTHLA